MVERRHLKWLIKELHTVICLGGAFSGRWGGAKIVNQNQVIMCCGTQCKVYLSALVF